MNVPSLTLRLLRLQGDKITWHLSNNLSRLGYNNEITRSFNCWTAGVTSIKRKKFERMYPTVLVLPDGSSLTIRYYEPRGIITLPLDLSTLSEEQKKLRILKRTPLTKVVIQEEEEDEFDEGKYLNIMRK